MLLNPANCTTDELIESIRDINDLRDLESLSAILVCYPPEPDREDEVERAIEQKYRELCVEVAANIARSFHKRRSHGRPTTAKIVLFPGVRT